jgi:hypothetical protein
MYISIVRTIYTNSLSLNINTFSKPTLNSYDSYIIINSTILETKILKPIGMKWI